MIASLKFSKMETLDVSSVASPFLWKLIPLLALLYLLFSELRRGLRLSGGAPGPPTYPFIGCLVAFYQNRRRLLNWYTELLSRSATGTIVVDRIGARRTVVTTNPDNVEYMLQTRFDNFPKGKSFRELLGDFLGKGIFNADGDLWRVQRKLISHQFSVRSLRQFTNHTLSGSVEKKLIPVLERMAAEERVVDLQELLQRFAFDLICNFSLGVEHGSLDPDQPESDISRAFDSSSMISALRGAAPLFLIWKAKRLLGVGSEKKLKESVSEVHDYVDSVIQDRIKKMKANEEVNINIDLLSRMLLDGHDLDAIRDMVVSFIMAGRDTTSAAMTWLFWSISSDSNIEENLVKEIRKNLEGQNMGYDSLKDLRYLHACLLESMRLYPPVVWDSKHAITDDILPDGTRVWAGDRVTYFPYGMGRMEAVWGKDRLDFKPDRWFNGLDRESGTLKKVCPFKYPVFQAGPRDCIGKEMAFAQMKYVVASILNRFEIKPVRQGKPLYVPLLTAHMGGGLPVRVYKRERAEVSS